MNDNQLPPPSPGEQPADMPAPSKGKRLALGLGGAAALVGLIVATGVAAGDNETDDQSAQTGTTTATAEVPASCLDAIDLMEEGFRHSGDGIDAMASGFDAGSRFDIGGIEQSAEDMEAASDRIDAVVPQMSLAAQECRAADAPEACITALNRGAEGFEVTGEISMIGSRGFEAAAEFDIDGIDRATQDMQAQAERLEEMVPGINQAKADCRAEQQ